MSTRLSTIMYLWRCKNISYKLVHYLYLVMKRFKFYVNHQHRMKFSMKYSREYSLKFCYYCGKWNYILEKAPQLKLWKVLITVIRVQSRGIEGVKNEMSMYNFSKRSVPRLGFLLERNTILDGVSLLRLIYHVIRAKYKALVM